jgi:hypothetical protein
LLRLKDKVEACVSANAAAVEKSDPSLAGAVTFLLDDLCSEQISAFERYRTNAAFLGQMKSKYAAQSYDAAISPLPSDGMGPGFQKSARADFARKKAHFETARIDPDSGHLIYATGADDDPLFAPGALREDVLSDSAGYPASSEFRAFAARVLLDARQSRVSR